MNAFTMLFVLLFGWGGAACIAIFTDRIEWAALVFVATLVVFMLWPNPGRRKK
jgi:hypothetical protein